MTSTEESQPPSYEAPSYSRQPGAHGQEPSSQEPFGAPLPGGPGAPQHGVPTYGGQGHSPYGSAGHGPQPGNGLAIAALVVGVLAVLTFLLGPVAIVLGLVAIVLGVLGRGRAKRGARYGGLAVAGLVLGLLGLVLGGFMTFAYASLFGSEQLDGFTQCLDQARTEVELKQCQREFEQSVDVPQ